MAAVGEGAGQEGGRVKGKEEENSAASASFSAWERSAIERSPCGIDTVILFHCSLLGVGVSPNPLPLPLVVILFLVFDFRFFDS